MFVQDDLLPCRRGFGEWEVILCPGRHWSMANNRKEQKCHLPGELSVAIVSSPSLWNRIYGECRLAVCERRSSTSTATSRPRISNTFRLTTGDRPPSAGISQAGASTLAILPCAGRRALSRTH